MEERVKYALKNFFNHEKFPYEADSSTYELIEKDDKGKSRLFVHVDTTENICVKNYDNPKKFSKWGIINTSKKIHMSKCVDHFIFKRNPPGIWELHIFEMKTSVGFKELYEIKYKLRSSYLSIKAIAVYLGITIRDEDITVYTTYEKDDKLKIANTTDPTVVLPHIGSKAFDIKKNEWDAGVINVPMIISENNPYKFISPIKLRHKKILMHRAEDGFLENTISI